MGKTQIALGTDYPFPLDELQPGKLIESMPIADSRKERLLRDTTLEFFNLSKDQFI